VNIARNFLLVALRAYKWVISPLLPPSCRYVPTCSEYAREAVERYGALRGAWMASRRILRCHPFVKGGYDPVTQQEGAGGTHGSGRYHPQHKQRWNRRPGFTR
jgi:putative membrane protein insertion efficiency factor